MLAIAFVYIGAVSFYTYRNHSQKLVQNKIYCFRIQANFNTYHKKEKDTDGFCHACSRCSAWIIEFGM